MVGAAEELGDDGPVRRHQHPRRQPGPGRRRSCASYGVDFPSFYSPGGEALLAFPGVLGLRTIPAFAVLDAEGRVAASIIGSCPSQQTLVDVTQDVVDETRWPKMAEWFQEQALSGSLLLAVPVALLAGLVSFFSRA